MSFLHFAILQRSVGSSFYRSSFDFMINHNCSLTALEKALACSRLECELASHFIIFHPGNGSLWWGFKNDTIHEKRERLVLWIQQISKCPLVQWISAFKHLNGETSAFIAQFLHDYIFMHFPSQKIVIFTWPMCLFFPLTWLIWFLRLEGWRKSHCPTDRRFRCSHRYQRR